MRAIYLFYYFFLWTQICQVKRQLLQKLAYQVSLISTSTHEVSLREQPGYRKTQVAKKYYIFSKTLSLGPEAVIKRGVFQPPGQQNGAFVEIVFCPQDGSGVFGS